MTPGVAGTTCVRTVVERGSSGGCEDPPSVTAEGRSDRLLTPSLPVSLDGTGGCVQIRPRGPTGSPRRAGRRRGSGWVYLVPTPPDVPTSTPSCVGILVDGPRSKTTAVGLSGVGAPFRPGVRRDRRRRGPHRTLKSFFYDTGQGALGMNRTGATTTSGGRVGPLHGPRGWHTTYGTLFLLR